jgi:hypothetical protein
MEYFIRYNNGLIVPFNKEFNKENIDRIYIQDKDNQYGFYLDGRFFVNSVIYDFKIPFRLYNVITTKTNKIILNTNEENISYNIGYKTSDNEMYYLNINDIITFIAQKDGKERTIILSKTK